MILYFLSYNNYYNKLIKRESTLSDYLPYLIGLPIRGIVNWNPSDGIKTEQIINNWSYGNPDYCVVTDDSNNIDSRWFVIDSDYLRNGQYRVSLHRDVIADNLDSVLNSTCYIEKGYVQNSSPLIFNKENMGFNQIKTSETLMSNNLNTPWVVLYLSRYNNEGNYNTFKGTFRDEGESSADYTLSSLSDYIYYKYSEQAIDAGSGEQYHYDNNSSIRFIGSFQTAREFGSTFQYRKYDIELANSGLTNTWIPPARNSSFGYPTIGYEDPLPSIDNATGYWNSLMNIYRQGNMTDPTTGLATNSYSGIGDSEGAETLNAESGKTINVGGTYYRIYVTTSVGGGTNVANVNRASSLGINMIAQLMKNSGIPVTSSDDPNLRVGWSENAYYTTLQIVQISSAANAITYDFTYNGGVTTDSVYEIIATPYRDVTFTNGGTTFNHVGRVGLQWFQDIINRYNGAGLAYDIQLVPYCSIDTTNITNENKIYCSNADTQLAVAFKLPAASFTKQYSISLPQIKTNRKISNETQLFRIVSPNGVGEYEFSPAKNGGFSRYEVDCTLIPFNPYIKVNPQFSNLYGSDFNDFRGLILGGDFSLPILNNQWSTYQLSNKYYQQIFNRNIESQEFNNKYALMSDTVGAVTGTLTGMGAGAALGTAIAPGVGTLVGGLVGGLGSGAAGAADVYINEQVRQESIDRQKDVFGMELGTIKARAQSLTRSSTYNVNNKYFPYVEYYTCTSTELTALENKLLYTGMTVGVIDTLSTYINTNADFTYVQGRIIDIDINDDAHMVYTINNELSGGIRIGKYTT